MNVKVMRPPELAKEWGLKPATIVAWIRAGELRAFDVARKGSKRPRYLIPADAILEFQEKRAAVKPKKPRRSSVKKTEKPADYVEYF